VALWLHPRGRKPIVLWAWGGAAQAPHGAWSTHDKDPILF